MMRQRRGHWHAAGNAGMAKRQVNMSALLKRNYAGFGRALFQFVTEQLRVMQLQASQHGPCTRWETFDQRHHEAKVQLCIT